MPRIERFSSTPRIRYSQEIAIDIAMENPVGDFSNIVTEPGLSKVISLGEGFRHDTSTRQMNNILGWEAMHTQ